MPEKSYQVDFKDIKSRVTLEMVLRHYAVFDKLKPKADNLVGVCPIHGTGSNPNQFSAHLEKNIWNCFGDCGGGGNTLDFVAKKEGVTIRQAAKLLQDWFLSPQDSGPGPGQKAGKPAARAEEKQAEPAKEESQAINPPLKFSLKKLEPDHPWFAERGILPATVEYFGLGYCSKGLMAGRIAMPIHNLAGDLVGYVGRAIDGEQAKREGKYKQPPGFHKLAEVYNLHRQTPRQEALILVESFVSVWRLHQAGWPNAVALMGSVLGQKQAEMILDRLSPTARVLLGFDADEAGQACARDCLARLGQRVWVRALDLTACGGKPHRVAPEVLPEIIRFV